jgi:hypothetical protein
MIRVPESDAAFAVFRRYARAGGVLDFVLYDEAEGDDDEARAAIRDALPPGDVALDALQGLGGHRVSEAQFFGDWYDPADGRLKRLGCLRTADGRELVDPKLVDLTGLDIVSAGWPMPEPGTGGQFAYALLNPPYGLRVQPPEVQKMFDAIRTVILPAGHDAIIIDWTSEDLPKVSRYFEAGMEWWGVFLWTIFVPDSRRMTVILGSATD